MSGRLSLFLAALGVGCSGQLGGAPIGMGGSGSSRATAGTIGHDGATGAGGAVGAGGAIGRGGPVGTGGVLGTGGAIAAGGMLGTGGTTSSGGGFCVDDGGVDPSETPVSGGFDGPAMSGVICTGGAIVYVDDNLAGKTSAALTGHDNALGPTPGIRFDLPADAVRGELSILIGMPTPIPGTFSSDTTCGNVLLAAVLPVPAGVNCTGDGGAAMAGACPPGCLPEGPAFAPSCEPIQPNISFIAQTATDCIGNNHPAQGSFVLTLESVELEPTDAGSSTIRRYRVHGGLSATLVGQAGDAGSSTVGLNLSF